MRKLDLPKNDFGREYLLALGAVYGVRSFNVYKGKLTAVFHTESVWEPGINHARCQVERYGTGWTPHIYKLAHAGWYAVWMPAGWNLEKKPPSHFDDAPQEDCTCGFYAYSADKTPGLGSVRGVVEITGRTLIGERGYRFEKGRIVALLDPTCSDTPDVPWRRAALEAIKENYADIPLFESAEAMFKAFPIDNPAEL